MTRAFYIGRFQPYHNGHQDVLERITEVADEIVIGVGSAQLSHEPDNPFTAGERILMITRSLKKIRIPLYVIPIEDFKRNALWVAHPFHDPALRSHLLEQPAGDAPVCRRGDTGQIPVPVCAGIA